MSRIFLFLVCWMMSIVVCQGQSELETRPHWNADPKGNINPNSQLRLLDYQRIPIGWKDEETFLSGNAVALPVHKGVIALTCPDAGGETSVSTTIDVPAKATHLTIVTRMRSVDFQATETASPDAGIVFMLSTQDGKSQTFPTVRPIHGYGSLGGWKAYRSTIQVPPDSSELNVRAFIADAKGSFEVDDLKVIPSQPGFEITDEQRMEFQAAIKNDDSDVVARLVQQHPPLLEFRDGIMENGTPLIVAACSNSAEVAKALIRLGADLEAFDETWGNTPLAWCCWFANLETAKILIEAGADTQKFQNRSIPGSKRNFNSSKKTAQFNQIVELIRAANQK